MKSRRFTIRSQSMRPDSQGGGVYTKLAPAVRKVRQRRRNAVAKQARKVNR